MPNSSSCRLPAIARTPLDHHLLVKRNKAPYLEQHSKPKGTQLLPLPEDNTIGIIAETYRLLGDPTRLKIVLTCLDGPIAVGDIAKVTGASQSLVSHHLRLLRAARLVRGTRKNKQVFYEAADHHIASMLADMIDHAMEEHH